MRNIIFLLACATLLMGCGFAAHPQPVVIYDGEYVSPDWDGLAAVVSNNVTNPVTNGINTSEHCVSVVRQCSTEDDNGGRAWSGGALWGGSSVNINVGKYNRLSMMVLKDVAGPVTLELQLDGSASTFVSTEYTTPGQWQNLVFDIRCREKTIQRIIVQIHSTTVPFAPAYQTMYWDNLIAFFACCDNAKPPIIDPPDCKIDTTLTKRTPTESVAAYKTFYKPANGNSGDPMPFYNEGDQTFYDFLLVEPINGAFARNHIFVTKTKDFANFGALSEPFPSGSDTEHDQWIGTGSCIKKDNIYHFFYSGLNDIFEASQVVMKATSTDLVNWNKVPSATIEAPDGYDKREFRDPCVYWDDTRNKYVMLVAGRKGSVAVIVRYQSDDLIAWDRIEDITATTSDNPQEFEVVTDTRMMECPDIFKIGSVWYLVFSRINADVHRKTFYRVADNPNGPWRISVEDGKHETFDGLFLYAAKTVSDGTTRYITGWASRGQEVDASGEYRWGGALVAHKLVPQPSGKLYPTIPDAVDAKFFKSVEYKNIKQSGTVSVSNNEYTLSSGGQVVFNRNGASFKIEMTIDASSGVSNNFGVAFGAYEDQQDVFRINFDLTSSNAYGCPALFMTHDNKEYNFTPLVVPEDKIFNIKIVAEESVCVMYVNGTTAFSNRIYAMNQNPWMIFAEQGTVKFSNIRIYKQ